MIEAEKRHPIAQARNKIVHHITEATIILAALQSNPNVDHEWLLKAVVALDTASSTVTAMAAKSLRKKEESA